MPCRACLPIADEIVTEPAEGVRLKGCLLATTRASGNSNQRDADCHRTIGLTLFSVLTAAIVLVASESDRVADG